MKYCFYLLLGAVITFAQSASTLYTTDVNGHRVTATQFVSSNGGRSELNQSINGRVVPLERTETKVLIDEPNRRVTETIVRKYDATGQLGSTERTVSEEQKRAGGSTIRATVYRSDANGRLEEGERRVIDTQTQGAVTTAAVTIARAGLNGSFETAEKRKVVTTVEGDTTRETTRETEIVERPAQGNLQFTEIARQIKESTKSGDTTTSTTAHYEIDYTGKMSVIRQEAATTTKNSDGTQVTELNLYAPSVYGIARDEKGGQKLREQQVIVRRETAGVVAETTTVRRPTLSDPTRLGAPLVISDLACTGKCDGPLKP